VPRPYKDAIAGDQTASGQPRFQGWPPIDHCLLSTVDCELLTDHCICYINCTLIAPTPVET
jgi:hypothetical protein